MVYYSNTTLKVVLCGNGGSGKFAYLEFFRNKADFKFGPNVKYKSSIGASELYTTLPTNKGLIKVHVLALNLNGDADFTTTLMELSFSMIVVPTLPS